MGSYLEQGELFQLRCMGLCAEILYEILRAIPVRTLSEEERRSADKRRARLDRFLRFVDENYMRKIRLADFAQAEGCSVSYLSRFLKASLNQTFQDYVNAVRFHSACKLIAGGSRKMLDVCQDSGYSDYRYFSAAFRAQCGMTPEEYRLSKPSASLPAQHSPHSMERFYTEAESRQLLRLL
jgi:AraC-like DNA-binding protein